MTDIMVWGMSTAARQLDDHGNGIKKTWKVLKLTQSFYVYQINARTVTSGYSCRRFDLHMTLTRYTVKLTLKRLIMVSRARHALTTIHVVIRHRRTTDCNA